MRVINYDTHPLPSPQLPAPLFIRLHTKNLSSVSFLHIFFFPMLKRPCKYFAQGACLKGERCNFSHGQRDSFKNTTQICNFYQKGMCCYGSRCRNLHVKSSWVDSAAAVGSSSSSFPQQSFPPKSVPPRVVTVKQAVVPAETSRTVVALSKQVSNSESRNVKPEDCPLCSLDAAGNCPHGDRCSHIHGDLCPTCAMHCLHPFRREEREEHLKACEKKQKHTEALKRSQEIECSVCLDPVLSKTTIAERKFAVMPECDHPFCISCIRKWRSTSPASGMASLRACPICRKPSHFVIPSHIWYFSKEEKQDIIDNYKANLRSIDCKHFNFGNGNCPFSANCFYKHTVKPGSYVWKYNKPPPRRPPRRSLPNDDFTNYLGGFDNEALYEDVIDELDMDDMYDDEDDCLDDDDALTHWDMAFLFTGIGFGSGGFSSDEDNDFY